MAKTASLRDKYKATPLDVLKVEAAQEDKAVGGGHKNEHYHDIEDGLNKMRIYPKKEDDKTYYHVEMVHWGSYEDDDDGEVKRRSVLNARFHSKLKRDINEEYIKDASAFIRDNDDDPDSAAKKLKAMTGDFKTSITGQMTWVCWADKIKRINGENVSELKLWRMKKTVRDGLNTEAMMEDPEEEITVDPYTDVDTGKAVLVTYNSKAKKAADYYTIKVSKESPLTDEQLQVFDEKPSLTKLLGNVYRKEDFELAVKMLQYFDEKNEIGLFEDEEWLEKVKAMKKEVLSVLAGNDPEEGEDDEEVKTTSKKSPAKTTAKSTKKAVVEEPEDDEDEQDEEEVEADAEVEDEDEDQEPTLEQKLAEMDRAELKRFRVDNGIDHLVKVFKNTTDDEIRAGILANMPSDDVSEEEAEDEAEEEVEVKETKKSAPKGKESLSTIKQRIMDSKKNAKK